MAIAVGPAETWEALAPTLESAVVQHGSRVEVVIKVFGTHLADDVRRFATAQHHVGIRLLEGHDRGIYDAYNLCAAAATGERLIFLGCGDELADAFVARDLYLHLGERNTVAMAGYGPVMIRDEGGRFKTMFDNRCFFGTRSLRPWRNPCHSQGLVYQRQWMIDHPFSLTLGPLADLVHTYAHELPSRAVWIPRPIASFQEGGASNQRTFKAFRARIRGLLANCDRFSPRRPWRLLTVIVCGLNYWLTR